MYLRIKFLLLSLFFLFSEYVGAKHIKEDDIDKTKYALQVSSCEDWVCAEGISEILQNEQFYITKVGNTYITYIVNIKNFQEAKKIQEKYKSIFPDSIIKRRFPDNKKIYQLKAYDEDFYINKNYEVKIIANNTIIYSLPEYKSKPIDKKLFGDYLKIDGCNDFGWCKIKGKKAYIPFYKIKFLKPLVAPPIVVTPLVATSKPKIKKIASKQKVVLDKYKIALINFKNKNYKKAYELFNELFQTNLNDVNINFYLGRSAFEIKKYHEAIIAYERVLFEKPNSLRVKLEMARAYFLNSSFNEAKRLFLDVKNDPKTPIAVLKNIDEYLLAIEKKIVKYSIGGIFMAGVNYDSNINNSASLDIWIEHVKNILNLPVDENNSVDNHYNDAWAHQEVAVINYAYKINEQMINKHDFMVFNRSMFNNKYKSKDVKLLSYTPALSVAYDKKLSVDYTFTIDNMWLNNINTLQTYSISPKLTYLYNNKYTINGYLKYQIKSNQQDNAKLQDSTYYEIGAGVKNFYSDKIILTPAIAFTKEKEKYSQANGVDKSSVALSLDSTYLYKPFLTFAPSVLYKQTFYSDKDSVYLKKAKNKEFKIGLVATYISSQKSIFQSGIDYITQDSNIPLNKYDKYTFTINFIRMF